LELELASCHPVNVAGEDVKYQFVKHAMKTKQIEIQLIDSKENPADALTKASSFIVGVLLENCNGIVAVRTNWNWNWLRVIQ
jgi:hypothetical protein